MKKKIRLIWQLYPSYLVLLLLSLFAVSWYASRSLHNFFIYRTQTDLQAQGQLLKNQIRSYLMPGNNVAVDRLCKEVGENTPTRVTVILPDGVVVGDSEETPRHMDNHGSRVEIRQALAGRIGMATRFSNTLQQNMMYVALPVTLDDATHAAVRTSIPLTSVENEIRSLQMKIIFGGFIIAVVASGICLFVSRRISLPIENMTHMAQRFAQGDLKHRIAPSHTIELASLANALNQMARQLENRIETVINQKNEYEAVLASMVEGVVAVDMEARILSINEAAAKILNSQEAEIKGRNILEAIRNHNVYQFVTNALSNGIYMESDVRLHRQGEQIIHLQCTPLRNAANQRIGTLLVLNDVTRIRNLENVRKEFVANVSHEIKTPLTAIKGFVETLLHGSVKTEAEREKFLGIINKHADRLGALIEDLLSLARLEQKDPAEKNNFDPRRLRDLIETAIQVIKTNADEKKIAFDFDCDENLRARLDGTLMEQAIVNLLDNAVKYSPVGSRVHISLERLAGQLCIHVADHGPGIPPHHLARLFERFYRVDKARSRKLGGTGLGLAIVKHICQVHGGSVSVQSELGKGSIFTISIPQDLIV